jgi:hypothetical protein
MSEYRSELWHLRSLHEMLYIRQKTLVLNVVGGNHAHGFFVPIELYHRLLHSAVIAADPRPAQNRCSHAVEHLDQLLKHGALMQVVSVRSGCFSEFTS